MICRYLEEAGYRLFGKLIIISLVVSLVVSGCADEVEHQSAEYLQFRDIYEPSGVQWLPGAGLVLIEDEQALTTRLLQIDDSFRISGYSVLQGLPAADDLEGISATADGWIYAITSHSVKGNGKRHPGREKLLKYKVEDTTAVSVSSADGTLRDDLTATFPQINYAMDALPKDSRRFNIEALARHRSQPSLLLGFRSPLVDGKAIIAQLDNPAAYAEGLEPAAFTAELIRLNLQGGGIRAMVYDESLGGYLIASRVEHSQDGNFALWLWSDEKTLQRLRIKTLSNLSNLEGISPVRIGGRSKLLLVFDDGNSEQGRAGHYAIADYALITQYD